MSQVRLDQSLFPEKKKVNGNNGAISVTPSKNGNGVKTNIGANDQGLSKLYVDVHEPEEIVEMLKAKGLYVVVKALPVADYAWGSGKRIVTKIEVLSEFEELLNKRLHICLPGGTGNCLLRNSLKRSLSLLEEVRNGKIGKRNICGGGGKPIQDTVEENVGKESEQYNLKDLGRRNGEGEEESTKIVLNSEDFKNFIPQQEENVRNVEMKTREFGKFTTWMRLDPKIEAKVDQLFMLRKVGKDCSSCVQIATELYIQILENGRFPLEIPGFGTGIERKTLHDFYNSIVHGDKHIWKQVFNLRYAFERPMLIIERWDDAFLSSPAMERTIRGAIASIFLMGISVLVIPGKGQNAKPFVDQIAYLFYSSDKKALSMRPVPEKNKSTRKIEILEDVLSILPAWGRKSSKLMIDSYQSIPNLLAASTSDLLKKGLNRKQIYYLKLLMKDEDLSDLLNVRKEDKLS